MKSSPAFTIFAKSASVTYALDAVLYRRRFAYFLIVIGVELAMNLMPSEGDADARQHKISVFFAQPNLFLHCSVRHRLDGNRRRAGDLTNAVGALAKRWTFRTTIALSRKHETYGGAAQSARLEIPDGALITRH